MYLLQLILLYSFTQTSSPSNSSVIHLTDKNFHKQCTTLEYLLVEFCTTWSLYCHRFQPHFNQAAEALAPDKPRLALGRIDCENDGNVTCTAHHVEKYPSLKLFKNGKFAKNYKESRVAWSLIKFMRAQIIPPSKELRDIESFRSFLARQQDAVLVGFFEEESRLKSAFLRVAADMKEKVIFGHTSNEKILKKEGVFDGIVLFRPQCYHSHYEEERVLYNGRAVMGELKIFIVNNFQGLVGYRTPYNLEFFYNPLVVVYYSVDYSNTHLQESVYWRSRVLKVAYKYKSRVNFAVSSKDDFEKDLRYFGLDAERATRPVVVARDLGNQKYIMREDFSRENLDQFVKNFLSSKVKPYVQSEVQSKPTPRHEGGIIYIAVAHNFQEVVIDNGFDTIIVFYAPWCVNSKKFSPVYEEVWKIMSSEDVFFVKMDATETEVPPQFRIMSYPTIYWLAKERKNKPVLYTGKREVSDLIKFIAREATEELRGFDRKGNVKSNHIVRTEL